MKAADRLLAAQPPIRPMEPTGDQVTDEMVFAAIEAYFKALPRPPVFDLHSRGMRAALTHALAIGTPAQTGVPEGWQSELREALAKATPQNIDTAQSVETDTITCPTCEGNGEVERKTFTNYDNVPLGVEFFGVGQAHLDAENLFRVLVKSARAMLASAPGGWREPSELADEIVRLRADLATYVKDTEATENRIIDAEFAETEAKNKLLDAENEIARLNALLATGGWRDIGTAPRDGTAIWLLIEGQPFLGYYDTGVFEEHDQWFVKASFWRRSRDRKLPDEIYGMNGYGVHPTHWQPLPHAPSGQEGK